MDDQTARARDRIRSGFYTNDLPLQESLIKVLDKAYRCSKRDIPGHTGFLNENACLIANSILSGMDGLRFSLTGGYSAAERKIVLFSPSWNPDPEMPVTLLRLHYPIRSAVSHRDVLGSLLSLGIKRDCIGDILPSDHSADILVLKEIAEFLEINLERIGKHHCICEEISPELILIPEKKVKLIQDTVASLRLDSVLSAAFMMPRNDAAELIRNGKVAVNGCETVRCADVVSPDATISCRGYGKCRFVRSDGISKKGRIRITLERFL